MAVKSRHTREMSQHPKACIIGAGISGLSMAKALRDKGVPFDCFEMSDQVGGNWVFKNKNGRSSAYRSLHIDTSKERPTTPIIPTLPSTWRTTATTSPSARSSPSIPR